MEINNDILTEAEAMQKEMNAFIKDLMKRRPKISYEDAQTVYFLYKMVELENNMPGLPVLTPIDAPPTE